MPTGHIKKEGEIMAEKIRTFEFRMSDKEFEQLKSNAKQRGISISAYIRETAIHQNGIVKNRNDFMLKKEFIQECNRLNYEINRVGNNINQIVKDYNSEFYSYSEKEKLKSLLNEIIELEKNITNMEKKLWQSQN